MRHRNKGRKLGRNPSHQRALLRNLASALILTERDAEHDENAPKVKGRIVTTLHKAKEVRPLGEKCITIARKSLPHQEAADRLDCGAERGSDTWARLAEQPRVAELEQGGRPSRPRAGRALRLLGDKKAVEILFEELGRGLPIDRAVTREY